MSDIEKKDQDANNADKRAVEDGVSSNKAHVVAAAAHVVAAEEHVEVARDHVKVEKDHIETEKKLEK